MDRYDRNRDDSTIKPSVDEEPHRKVKASKEPKVAIEGISCKRPLAIKGISCKRSVAVKGIDNKSSVAEGVSQLVWKYYPVQRYNFFSRFDEGIRMDEEGWFSLTPEEITIRHAERCGGGVVIGGNAIQFARMCYHVMAIEIDPQTVRLAINNARIYGVEDYIDFVIGDFFQLAPSLKIPCRRCK